MKNKILLGLAVILVSIGIFKPDLSWIINKPHNVVVDEIIVITPPSDQALKDACVNVISSISSGPSSKTKDGKRLASLYLDIATLVELDGSDQAIKTTNEIRQANSLSGSMLKLNIKDKYPKLAESANAVLVVAIGDEDTVLSPDLRAKSAEAFRALAWACNEGAK